MMKKKNTAGIQPISPKSEVDYMAEDDLRTLKRAEEIKADSKRMENAKKKAMEEMKAMSKVAMSMLKPKKENHAKSFKEHLSKQKAMTKPMKK